MKTKKELIVSEMPINAPWVISDLDKIWNECFAWLQKQKLTLYDISVRYSKVSFVKNGTPWKLYLPYEDTKLLTVLLNESSCKWVEIKSLKQFKSVLNAQTKQ